MYLKGRTIDLQPQSQTWETSYQRFGQGNLSDSQSNIGIFWVFFLYLFLLFFSDYTMGGPIYIPSAVVKGFFYPQSCQHLLLLGFLDDSYSYEGDTELQKLCFSFVWWLRTLNTFQVLVGSAFHILRAVLNLLAFYWLDDFFMWISCCSLCGLHTDTLPGVCWEGSLRYSQCCPVISSAHCLCCAEDF